MYVYIFHRRTTEPILINVVSIDSSVCNNFHKALPLIYRGFAVVHNIPYNVLLLTIERHLELFQPMILPKQEYQMDGILIT